MNELVEQLSKKQPIVGGGNFRGLEAFKEQIDKDYVFIKFTEPYGSIDLAIHPDPQTSDWENADFENGSGNVHLEGEVGLNYVKCRLVADVNLEDLKGEGYLVPVEEMPESAEYEAAKKRFEEMDKEAEKSQESASS
ncbi:MAG: hypothetical protein P8Y45_00455 [Exilibacterium sp.]